MTGSVVAECSVDFFGGVHDKSAAHGDRLADGFATHQEQLAAFGARDGDLVAVVVEDGGVSFAQRLSVGDELPGDVG